MTMLTEVRLFFLNGDDCNREVLPVSIKNADACHRKL